MKTKYFTVIIDKFLNNLINNVLYEYDTAKCNSIIEMMPFIPETTIVQVFQQFKGDLALAADFLAKHSNEIISNISDSKESLKPLKKIAYDMCGLIFIDQNLVSKAIFDSHDMRDKILDSHFKNKISEIVFDFFEGYFDEISENSEFFSQREFNSLIPDDNWKNPNSSKWQNFDNKINRHIANVKICDDRQRRTADDLVKEKVRILYNLTNNSYDKMDNQLKSYMLQKACEIGYSIVNALLHNFSLDIDSGMWLIKVDFHALGKNEALLLFHSMHEKIEEVLKSSRLLKGLKIHLITGKSRKSSEPFGTISSVLLKQIKLINYK